MDILWITKVMRNSKSFIQMYVVKLVGTKGINRDISLPVLKFLLRFKCSDPRIEV